MKIKFECLPCQVSVRVKDIEKVCRDEVCKIELIKHVFKIIHDELNRGVNVAPIIATKLFRFIKNFTRIEDPYWEDKVKANIEGLKLYEKLREEI